MHHRTTRRRVFLATGALLASSVLAGCSEPEDDLPEDDNGIPDS